MTLGEISNIGRPKSDEANRHKSAMALPAVENNEKENMVKYQDAIKTTEITKEPVVEDEKPPLMPDECERTNKMDEKISGTSLHDIQTDVSMNGNTDTDELGDRSTLEDPGNLRVEEKGDTNTSLAEPSCPVKAEPEDSFEEPTATPPISSDALLDDASTLEPASAASLITDVTPAKNQHIKVEPCTGTSFVTPLSTRKKLDNISVKNSPSTPGTITDEMMEEEKLYQKEREKEQEIDDVRTQALEELARTGQQERFDRLQNLLSRSEAYSTYLLGRVNSRREEEERKAAAEKKKKETEAERLKEKEEKQKLNEQLNSQRSLRRKDVIIDEKSSQESMKSSKRKRRSGTDEANAGKRKRQNEKSQVNLTSEAPEFSDNPDSPVDVKGSSEPTVDERPEAQPRLLTGGVLRKYQIEGMEWMIGLYENGTNGILADEMGLGKTLQSIALICRLIEQKVVGPYLIAAPLSTLPNWVAEFKKFAPEVYTILYHGSKEERREKRETMMRVKKYSHGFRSLPVVISSYEVLMRDRQELSALAKNIEWKYLIVDEGHRIKNLNCKLIKELKQYNTGNRLLLTGTPLQNNLAELWSLLNFLLPDIFDDLVSFQQWFDFSALESQTFIADEQEAQVLQTLHSILNPFLLRRLKTDVDLSIPPKKEVLVYCPMTVEQQNYYRTTCDRTVLKMIEEKNTPAEEQALTPAGRPLRKTAKDVKYEEYDEESLTSGKSFDWDLMVQKIEEEDNRRTEKELEKLKKEGKKSILNIRLVNVMMMLRKCCNHPYLLEYPYDSETNQLIIDERLLTCSGKLLMLDRMLQALLAKGHKILIFSQMCLMLDIIVDYLNMKDINFSRLDGSMSVQDRHDNIETFNTDPETNIFLLSTRAGGLGLNLMIADTCIIYDSDWNPQVDLQAQDRCHRIGQKNPVVIYRFVTANTIDQRILERASSKRKLEKMVVHEKRFKGKALSKALTPVELVQLLESSDVSSTFDTENVITDAQLEMLLDRSDLHKMMEKAKNDRCGSEKNTSMEDEDKEMEYSENKLFTILDTSISDAVVF